MHGSCAMKMSRQFHARIERVTQPVAEEVETGDRDRDQRAGKIASHGAEVRYSCALFSMLPQLGVGG